MPQATIPNSSVFDIEGSDSRFRISVGWPETPPPETGWPVVLVLDGNRYFPVVCFSARTQARRPALTHVEPALIVGIDHLPGGDRVAQRLWHMTPEAPTERMRLRPNGQPWPKTGGAEILRNVLLEVLLPRLSKEWQIDQSRISLFGHSLGGLFVLDWLIQDPEQFESYLISSPSLWYADGIMFERLPQLAARLVASSARPNVQLTIGNLEQSVPPERHAAVGEAYLDWVEGNRMVDHAKALAEALGALPGLALKFRIFEDETHITAPALAIGQGLRVALRPRGLQGQ